MNTEVVVGTVMDDNARVSLAQVCRVCRVEERWVVELVAHGVAEPRGASRASWEFDAEALRRLRIATRLQRDLGVNPAGAALAVDLMTELDRLRALLATR